MRMLRRMMVVQRSARSSDVRAMGQYCPYVLMSAACHRGATGASSSSELDGLGPTDPNSSRPAVVESCGRRLPMAAVVRQADRLVGHLLEWLALLGAYARPPFQPLPGRHQRRRRGRRSFPWSFRQAPLGTTEPHQMDGLPNLSSENGTLSDGMDGRGSTSNP